MWRRACSNGSKGEAVNTSIIVGAIALVLAGLLATGHAFEQEEASVMQPVVSAVQVKS